MTALLNVINSLCGKKWEAVAYDDRIASAIETQLGAPSLIAQLLAARGLSPETAPAFLNPRLKDAMPDPSSLKDMDKAVERFIAALDGGQKITVFGDYDVDGGTSSALLRRFGRAIGADIEMYIPDRIAEGYGPNVMAMDKLKQGGAELVITVDCGTTAHEPLRHAAAIGLDVIVIDHHAAEPQLPPAVAVINPNRLDEKNDIGTCAAVGVTFLFVTAVNRALRERGFYTETRPEPNLMQWLDLVAAGTVADVVPLTGLNRAFVAQGLKVMARRENMGMTALADIGRMTGAPDAFACGFVLGPRINAGGRVGQSDLGARILSTDNATEARELASTLDAHNAARKILDTEVLEEAIVKTAGHNGNMVVAVGRGWHPGVIGIVAARLKERYHRPTFVIAVDEKGIGKGSGRSIKGIDLGALTIAARQSGLLVSGGGHAMAAGLTVAEDKILDLQAFFEERLEGVLTAEIAQPRLMVDGLISLGAFNMEFYQNVQQLAPFGSGNYEPRFALTNVRVIKASLMKDKHMSVVLSDDAGNSVRGVAFNCAANDMGQALLAKRALHIVGRMTLNSWQGRNTIEIQIEDAAVA